MKLNNWHNNPKNSTNKKSKYINKKCDWCHNWWDGEKFTAKICDFHQKYSYERCLKKIKAERWDRLKWRIILGIFSAVVILGLILAINDLANWHQINESLQIETIILLVKCVIISPFLVWTIIKNEKEAKRWIKDLEKEKKEWAEIN